MSLDINQLAEALAWHDSADGHCPLPPVGHALIDAAYLIVSGEYVPKGQGILVPKGQPIKWCTYHDSPECVHDPDDDQIPHCIDYDTPPYNSCRIVDGYLHLEEEK